MGCAMSESLEGHSACCSDRCRETATAAKGPVLPAHIIAPDDEGDAEVGIMDSGVECLALARDSDCVSKGLSQKLLAIHRRQTDMDTTALQIKTTDQQSDGASMASNEVFGSQNSSKSSASSVSSDCSTRSTQRHSCRRLKVVETMGHVPSAALQFVINNPCAIEDVYKLEHTLGKGAFGTVKLGRVKATNAKRAIKTISKDLMKEHVTALKLEMEIMKMLDHPGVVMLFEIFEEEDHLHLSMELCQGGSLHDRVRKSRRSCLEDVEAAEAMRQLLSAVAYLHVHMIIHRDLKAENVLSRVSASDPLGKNSLKISDFGLSRIVKEGEFLTSVAGTLSHMAPEVLAKKYDHACDMWSCGVILYFLLSGQLPFDSEKEITKGKYKMTATPWASVQQPAVAFLAMLLAKKTSTRYTAKTALQDEWLKIQASSVELGTRSSLLQDMHAFRAMNKFKRAVLSIAASMLPDTLVQPSRDLFINLDVDGDGVISIKDLKVAGSVACGMGAKLTTSQAKAALHDGYGLEENTKPYGYTEFIAAMMDPRVYMGPKFLRVAFNCFDRNGDGSISLSELSDGHLLGHLSLEELHAIICGHDKDGDEQINFEEFVEMMKEDT
eukprot:TRINITY_DN109614_c0_g1_i1.p1 TRINITY_DN109614_c0_g1~~TRINITY_DN109614_c0_g1_i1.p1  ORF type:complete len:610 (-),score=97.10 TRINITY_DN109614_c0_g1_i1:182-2011(-)